MKTAKTIKLVFISSIIATLLCITFFVGSTFSWLFNTSSSSGNKAISGNVDIEVWVDGKNESYSNEPIFTADTIWEPEFTEGHVIQVRNTGSLPVKLSILFNSINQDTTYPISDVIDVKIAVLEDLTDCPVYDKDEYALQEFEKVATLKQVLSDSSYFMAHLGDAILEAGENVTLVVVFEVFADIPNVYQDKTDSFDIVVVASQVIPYQN